MSNRFAQVVILAEDERSANFLRRYVMRALDIGNRRIRQQISPSGSGDAKQWVLGRYAIEVRALRSRHPKSGLVVHLDADVEPVAKRAAQLASMLMHATRMPARPTSGSATRFHDGTQKPGSAPSRAWPSMKKKIASGNADCPILMLSCSRRPWNCTA